MKLAALGDLFLGDQLAYVGCGVRSFCDLNGYDHLFEGISPILKRHDFVVANLESVLSQAPEGAPDSLHRVLNRGAPRAAASIRNAGINLLTLANNHIFDYGRQGVDDTVAALNATGLAHCGTRHQSIHVHRDDGRSYAFLSWSLVPDGAPEQRAYNFTEDLEPIIAELRQASAIADKRILSLHAGNEFIGQPSQEFQQLCHRLVDAGANIILGHHPHALQPVERYKHGLIAYSLGNCIFESWDPACCTGMVLSVSVEDTNLWEPTFFHIDQRSFSPAPITDAKRLKQLRLQISSPKPLPKGTYQAIVHRRRTQYRKAALLHALRNLRRMKWRRQLLLLAIRRLNFLWSIRSSERHDPNAVYMSRSHLQRSDQA
jgi:poly-gamma-glutamate synthesis protein (capsule biosynthesis protein)